MNMIIMRKRCSFKYITMKSVTSIPRYSNEGSIKVKIDEVNGKPLPKTKFLVLKRRKIFQSTSCNKE